MIQWIYSQKLNHLGLPALILSLVNISLKQLHWTLRCLAFQARVKEERNTPCRSVVVRTPKPEVSSVYEYFFRPARLNISEMSKLYVQNFLLFVELTVQWTCSFQFSDFSFEMICSRKPFIKGGKWWQVSVILALRILRQEDPTLRPVWATEQDIAEEKNNSKQQPKVESPWLFLVFVYRYQETVCLHLKPDIVSRHLCCFGFLICF